MGRCPTPRPREKGIYARLRLALRPCVVYMRGFTPHPDSRTFLGKSPRDPKKPDCIGFRLSSVDSEQGCRRQPCFMFGAHSAAPQPPRCPACPPHPHPPQGSHARAHRTARTLTAHTSPAQSLARTVLRHRRALPAPDSARLPAEVLKLQGLSFCQSISNFVVGFPNLSKKDVKGLLFRK